MRPVLRWALAAAALASAAAWQWGEDSSPPPALVEVAARPAAAVSMLAPGAPLPAALEGWAVPSATRDVFAVAAPPAVADPKPVPVAEAGPFVGPERPVAPPVNYRYLGRMQNPSGEVQTLLQREGNEAPISVRSGQRLEEGYVVQKIEAQSVRLVYPLLGTVVDIPIPPPPGADMGWAN